MTLFFEYTSSMKKAHKRILCLSVLVLLLDLSLFMPLAALAAGLFAPGMPLNPAIRKASQVSACYNVQDADARSYCLARARREPSQCYNVQRSDLRAQCLAEVSR